MAGIDPTPGIQQVLERLVTEPAFAAELERDPKAALAGYDLSATDLDVLSARLSTDAGGMGSVEQRTSKSAMVGLLSGFAEGANEIIDTDGDGLSDATEALYGTDPAIADSDGDGLTDSEEVAFGTDPLDADTDGDKESDGKEVTLFGTDPLAKDVWVDHDGDEEPDVYENLHGTDPYDADTDDDGLSDFDELHVHGTDPTNLDTDGDGVSDSWELKKGTDPENVDTDGDGWSDVLEHDGGTGSDPDQHPDVPGDIHERAEGTAPLPLGDQPAEEPETDSDGAAPDQDALAEGALGPSPFAPEEPAVVVDMDPTEGVLDTSDLDPDDVGIEIIDPPEGGNVGGIHDLGDADFQGSTPGEVTNDGVVEEAGVDEAAQIADINPRDGI